MYGTSMVVRSGMINNAEAIAGLQRVQCILITEDVRVRRARERALECPRI